MPEPLFTMKSALAVLNKKFKLTAFWPEQDQALQTIASGMNTLVVMRTGGGKSVCFQVPAAITVGTVLVISPLISLMKDQVGHCRTIGLDADAIYTGVPKQDSIVKRFGRGEYELLYVAPERLRNRQFVEALAKCPISMVVVDEAHCIARWGKDFRPSYRYIPVMVDQMKSPTGERPPIMLATATCTPETEADIARMLNIVGNYKRISGDPTRANIEYMVGDNDVDFCRLIGGMVSENPAGRHIVYTWSRKNCETLAEELRNEGVYALPYHAGLTDRANIQDRFTSSEVKVIVATNAFGMGVNIPDIRSVTHVGEPGSIEDYIQETGRAGRDGLPSRAILIPHPQAARFRWSTHETANPAYEELEKLWQKLNAMQEKQGTSLIKYAVFDLGRAMGMHSDKIETLLRYMEAAGLVTSYSTMRGINIVIPNRNNLFPVMNAGGLSGQLAGLLLEDMRVTGKTQFGVDATLYAEHCGTDASAVSATLTDMSETGVIRIEARFQGATLQLYHTGDDMSPVLPRHVVKEKSDTDALKLRMMLGYKQIADDVRKTYVRDYFTIPLKEFATKYNYR